MFRENLLPARAVQRRSNSTYNSHSSRSSHHRFYRVVRTRRITARNPSREQRQGSVHFVLEPRAPPTDSLFNLSFVRGSGPLDLGGCGFEPPAGWVIRIFEGSSLPVGFQGGGGRSLNCSSRGQRQRTNFLVLWDVTLRETLTFDLNGGVCVGCDSAARRCFVAPVHATLTLNFRRFFQSGSHSPNTHGLKSFSGNNTSRYSYLVKGHENPYYLAADV